MHTTPSGGQQLTASDFFVRFGDQRPLERLPLRQGWQLLSGRPASLSLTPQREGRERSKYAVIPQGAAGEIWALNERALREGRQAVQEAHRDDVSFSPPRVHTYLDPLRLVAMEPLMFVKVNAQRKDLEPILQELRSRGARMQEVELQGRRIVVRAAARLTALLGFDDAVALCADSAQVFSWLVRYEAAAATATTLAKE